MNTSKIEWTEATWSPVIGCTKVSAGCKHCYAEREVETRWSKNPKSIWYGRSFTDVLCRPVALAGAGSPMRWKKPRRIFVCPRADLFHDDVPAAFLDQVFAVMAACPQHTFQVLTKRTASMRAYVNDYQRRQETTGIVVPDSVMQYLRGRTSMPELLWPLPNVHLGVSIEDQPSADERIGELLQTPAAVHWVSAEPLLEPIWIAKLLRPTCSLHGALASDGHCDVCVGRGLWSLPPHPRPSPKRRYLPAIDWLVVGGESGPDARPVHPDWVRGLRDQCETAGVPFLFKQWGEWAPAKDTAGQRGIITDMDGCVTMRRTGKHRAGRLLDGVLHDAYPEVRS